MDWVDAVRIVVIGDGEVGKTSLITAAATETYPDNPPPLLPPTKLPPDATPEGVPLIITDTSSRPEDRQSLEAALQEANVIVLAFDKGPSDSCGPSRFFLLFTMRWLSQGQKMLERIVQTACTSINLSTLEPQF